MKKNKSERLAAKAAATSTTPAKEVKNVKGTAPAVEGKPAKGKKVDKTVVDDATATATVARITEKKDLKYIYPADCEEGDDKVALLERRKKFRASVRRKVEAFEKKIKGLMKSNTKEDLVLMGKVTKDFNSFKKEVYVNPEI